MFTGLVEELGVVVDLRPQDDAARVTIRGPVVLRDTSPGDSVAVDGCCLTVAERDEETFTADVMLETLRRTSLGSRQPGDRVNLERAAAVGERLGGHIVQGHVDGVGTVLERTPSAHWDLVTVSCSPSLARYLVAKGSVTVDGVSLTVVEVDDERSCFTVSLIPETLARTTLGERGPGDPVNLEVDIVAKYVERLLGTRLTAVPSEAGNAEEEQ